MNTDLINDALRLKELDRLVVKATIEGTVKDQFKLLDEFRNLKKSIKIRLIDTTIAKINNKEVRFIMNRIVNEYLFESDKILVNLENITGVQFCVDALEIEETDQLESDLFYSWFSGLEYINVILVGEIEKRAGKEK